MDPITALELVGRDPALDFLNTIEDRRGPCPVDLLRSPRDLAAWGQHAGLLNGGRLTRGAQTEFAAALELRGHLIAVLDSLVASRPPAALDLRALAAAVGGAQAAGTLSPSGAHALAWSWDPTALSTIRHAVAHAAEDLLTGSRAGRVRQCAGPGCGWFFIDTTKRGNRRWCSMSDCGQAAKSARRSRQKKDPASRRAPVSSRA